MAGYTNAMCGSFRGELAQAGHCFNATVTPTATLTNGQTTLGSLSSSTGLVHGMPVTNANIPANTFILNNAGTWLLSQAATGGGAGQTLTCSGDAFWIALGKQSPTGTYDAGTTNYSNLTGNSDETTGTAYSAGGQQLQNNITPQSSGSGASGNAWWQWSINPSWSGATFSCAGALIYNKSNRLPTANRAVGVCNIGNQQVTAGTFTLLQPSNAVSTSLLQIN